MAILDAIQRAGRALDENNVPFRMAAYLSVDQAAKLYDEVMVGSSHLFVASNAVKARHIHNGTCWGTKILVEGME